MILVLAVVPPAGARLLRLPRSPAGAPTVGHVRHHGPPRRAARAAALGAGAVGLAIAWTHALLLTGAGVAWSL